MQYGIGTTALLATYSIGFIMILPYMIMYSPKNICETLNYAVRGTLYSYM